MSRENYLGDVTGTLYVEGEEVGIRFIVLRGPSSLCAYIGLPVDHPLWGKSYTDIPLDVNGGLTYGRAGDGVCLPTDFWWYGWDHAHAGDYFVISGYIHEGYHWTVDDVEEEARRACRQLLEIKLEIQ